MWSFIYSLTLACMPHSWVCIHVCIDAFICACIIHVCVPSFTCAFMYMYTHACVHALFTCVPSSTCAFMYIYSHACVHLFVCACIHVCTPSSTCAFMYMYTHACVHSFMCACLHPRVHAFMHTRVLLCALILSCVHAFLPLPCSRAGPGRGLVNSTDSAPALPELTFWKEMDPEPADRKLRGRGELRRRGLGSSAVGPC